jgi:hypothetical protein
MKLSILRMRGNVLVLGILVGALSLAGLNAQAGGRWLSHTVSKVPPAGSPARPIEEFQIPETAGHWVWVAWFDMSKGLWTYDYANPYFYSVDGTVEFRAPAVNVWYFVYFYDTVTGVFY